MRVIVTEGVQVVHEGRHHFGGQTVDVPEPVATIWIRYGWARDDPADVDTRRAKVAELRAAGVSIRDIADRLGVSRSAVERDLKAP